MYMKWWNQTKNWKKARLHGTRLGLGRNVARSAHATWHDRATSFREKSKKLHRPMLLYTWSVKQRTWCLKQKKRKKEALRITATQIRRNASTSLINGPSICWRQKRPSSCKAFNTQISTSMYPIETNNSFNLFTTFISKGKYKEVTCCCDSPEQHCNTKFAKPIQIYPEQEDRACKFRCKIDPLVKE